MYLAKKSSRRQQEQQRPRRIDCIKDLSDWGCEQVTRSHGYDLIQNVAEPRRNGCIGKVFELVELCFRRCMERYFCIIVIFPDHD